ncbi:MAG: hypothetical protein AABY22_14985 [Nanoarchaeota archaeon]
MTEEYRLTQRQELISGAQAADIQILEQYKDRISLLNLKDESGIFKGVLRLIGGEFTYWTNISFCSYWGDPRGFEEHPEDLINPERWEQVSSKCIPRSNIEEIVLVEDVLKLRQPQSGETQ